MKKGFHYLLLISNPNNNVAFETALKNCKGLGDITL
jgi:hypothetical protein